MAVTIEDLTVGSGSEAVDGKLITVHYTALIAPNIPITAPLEPGETIEVPVNGEMMIDGWNEGVLGMKVGGKRRITVPAELAYRNVGLGDIVPESATLIFEIDLLSVRDIPT